MNLFSMWIDSLVIVFSVATVYLVGLALLYLILPVKRFAFLERQGYAYGLGVGAIGLQLFVYSLFRVPWSAGLILAPWFLVFLIIGKQWVASSFSGVHFSIGRNLIDRIFYLLLFALCLFVLFEALLRPIPAWDGWAHWYLGAKAYFLDGFVNPTYISYADVSTPPVINLFITFVYTLLGYENDQLTLILFTFFYYSMLLVFYFAVSERTNTRYALFATFLLAATQNFVRHAGRYDVGHADLAVGYFFLSSVVLLFQFLKTKQNRVLLLLSVFLGIGALVKNEGIPFAFIVAGVVIFTALRTRRFKALFYLLPGFVIIASWQVFKFVYHLPLSSPYAGEIVIERTTTVVWLFVQEFLYIGRWNLLWVVFFLSIFVRKYTQERVILAIIFFCQLFVYFMTFLTTQADPIKHSNNSLDRLLLQIASLAILFAALSLYPVFRNNRVLRRFV